MRVLEDDRVAYQAINSLIFYENPHRHGAGRGCMGIGMVLSVRRPRRAALYVRVSTDTPLAKGKRSAEETGCEHEARHTAAYRKRE